MAAIGSIISVMMHCCRNREGIPLKNNEENKPRDESRGFESDRISDRLDVLIRLSLEQKKKDDGSLTLGDQIVFLESTGLKGKDVAKILGLDVRQLSSNRRSANRKKKKHIEDGRRPV